MKQYDVIVESRARDDLRFRYRQLIRTTSPAAAERWLRDLEEALGSLSSLPGRCPVAPESGAFSVTIRQLLARDQRILFTVSAETSTVHVLHVRHQARERWKR